MLFPNADVVVNPVLLALLGVIVGTLGGFFGVGGGFLITGGLLVFGVPEIYAIGTGLTLIMGSSIINMLKHRGLGNVDFKLGIPMVLGALPAVFIAESLNSALEEAGQVGNVIPYIYVAVLVLLGSFLVYDYFKTRRRTAPNGAGVEAVSTAGLTRKVQSLRIPPHSVQLPGLPARSTYISLKVSGIERISVFVPFLVGFGIGFFAGLLGAGGGFILMPVLVYVVGIPTTVAIGTDLFQVIITGSWGTLLYALDNHVDPLMALIILAAASVGSQIGATATRYVDPSRIRILYGITVLSGALAIGMGQVGKVSVSVAFLSRIDDWVLLGVPGCMCVAITVLMVREAVRRRNRSLVEQSHLHG